VVRCYFFTPGPESVSPTFPPQRSPWSNAGLTSISLKNFGIRGNSWPHRVRASLSWYCQHSELFKMVQNYASFMVLRLWVSLFYLSKIVNKINTTDNVMFFTQNIIYNVNCLSTLWQPKCAVINQSCQTIYCHLYGLFNLSNWVLHQDISRQKGAQSQNWWTNSQIDRKHVPGSTFVVGFSRTVTYLLFD